MTRVKSTMRYYGAVSVPNTTTGRLNKIAY